MTIYPQAFWTDLITETPEDISPRLKRVILNRLARLPHIVIVEIRHTICRWLEQNLADLLEFDDVLGWLVFDHVVDGVSSGGVDATESGIGEMRSGGEVVQRSRRTYSHAFAGPLGMCAEALFRSVPGDEQEKGSLVPTYIKGRLERLFASPGEGSDHAVAVAFHRLNWLVYVDPEWTESRLLPMLAFEHPAAEPTAL